MLSIGAFSNLCKVSAKTLRYYAEIGLLLPKEINAASGYRYYSIDQLETMLFINRLKEYSFSLEEIKCILDCKSNKDEVLLEQLQHKQQELIQQMQVFDQTLTRLKKDIVTIEQGNSMMSYLDQIDVQLVEVKDMHLLSVRKLVHEQDCASEYQICFASLFSRIKQEALTMTAPPMVLFHNDEFQPSGLDIEFAVPMQEGVEGTRDFHPGLCLKTTLHGSYLELPSIYARQREWAEKEGYENQGALFEIYVKDPSLVKDARDLITEIYYPVKKSTARM